MVFFPAFLYNGCMDKKKLLLIDGSSVAFRAFFALYQQLDRFKNAADILIKNAPELKEKRDFVIESQKYLSKEYASDKEKWGQFDAARWNAFYKWDKENGILKEDLTDKGFTNEFVK